MIIIICNKNNNTDNNTDNRFSQFIFCIFLIKSFLNIAVNI